MVIGVVGLGLIGGSFAKAAHNLGNDTILGFDIDESVVYKAVLVEAIDAITIFDEDRRIAVENMRLEPHELIHLVNVAVVERICEEIV